MFTSLRAAVRCMPVLYIYIHTQESTALLQFTVSPVRVVGDAGDYRELTLHHVTHNFTSMTSASVEVISPKRHHVQFAVLLKVKHDCTYSY